jgi:protein O-mannosyl-transferase
VSPFNKHITPARALILCAALAAVCYANSLPNAFILDDVLIVAANEHIRHIDPAHVWFQSYWGDLNHAGIYRPLTIFSFSLEYPIWHVWASGYRLTNVTLHALNGWLVFLLVDGLLASPPGALAAAAVYIIHPVQTEAVVSIVGRSELLAACLFFTALLLFRKGGTGWAALIYLLAALAKESAITFPAIAMLDLALAGGIRPMIHAWRRFAVLAGTGVAYLALRFHVLHGLGIPPSGQYLDGTMTLVQRWMTSGRVFIQYFRLLLFPVRVTGDYDFNSIPVAGLRDWDAWGGLLLIAAVIAFALLAVKKRPAVTFGILFFFVALLPVSNWVMPIALLMAERFLYTPVFGFALLAGMVWSGIQDKGPRWIVAGGVVAISVILCVSHNYIWQDTLTFHENAVRALPQNARARIGYGFALLRMGKAEEAKAQFEAGLKIKPNSAPLLAGLANTLMRIDGRCDRVRPVLAQALAVEPGHWQSLWVLGDCFALDGKTELAEQSYRIAIQNSEFPDAKLLVSWGRLLEAQGKTPTAIAAYQRAAVIDPADEGIKARLKQLTREN